MPPRGLRFSSQPIVRLRVLKDSTSFSTEADSASDVIGTKELSSAPQVFNADVRSSVVLSVDVLSHPSSLLEMHGAYPHRPRSSSSSPVGFYNSVVVVRRITPGLSPGYEAPTGQSINVLSNVSRDLGGVCRALQPAQKHKVNFGGAVWGSRC
jgi:hypothetical protein